MMDYMFQPVGPRGTVIIVGADYDAIRHFAGVAENGLVVVVDPNISCVRNVCRIMVEEGLANVVPVLGAIDVSDGATIFSLASNEENSSTLFHVGSENRFVLCFSWETLMATLGLRSVDLALFDCEGCELSFLEGLKTFKPESVIMEEHSRLGYSFSLLEALIRPKGYKLVKRDGIYLYLRRAE